MVRGALTVLLNLEEYLEVVAEVSQGDQVLLTAKKNKPDIALRDIEMPCSDGLSAAEGLHKNLPSCRIVILTTLGRSGYLRRAMKSGAVGFLLKDAPAEQLAIAIRRVMAGERLVDPELALSALTDGDNPLTGRERDVLKASLEGACIADIAAQLYLSEGLSVITSPQRSKSSMSTTDMEAAHLAREGLAVVSVCSSNYL